MSRSDGKFPSYHKYKLDPEIWPHEYWDHSYRCSNCATHWPANAFFAKTPCCEASVEKTTEPPDMRWPDAIMRLNEARFERLYDEWNENKSDEDLSVDSVLEEIQNIEALIEDSSRA